MVLRNFKKALVLNICCKNLYDKIANDSNIKMMNGRQWGELSYINDIRGCTDSMHSYTDDNTTLFYGTDIIIGNGAKSVDETDYELDSELPIDNIQFVSMKCYYSTLNGGRIFDFVKTMKNNTGETLTITEIGLVGGIVNPNRNSDAYLFTREVLEEPIVVPAGGYFTIQTGLKFNI